MIKVMESGGTEVPDTFDFLDDSYCSAGQEQNYYETMAELPKDVLHSILKGLRCVAMGISLLRFVSRSL